MTVREKSPNLLQVIEDNKYITYVKKHKRGEKFILTCNCRIFQATHECRHVSHVRKLAPDKYVVNMLNNIHLDEWFGNIQAQILAFLKALRF